MRLLLLLHLNCVRHIGARGRVRGVELQVRLRHCLRDVVAQVVLQWKVQHCGVCLLAFEALHRHTDKLRVDAICRVKGYR